MSPGLWNQTWLSIFLSIRVALCLSSSSFTFLVKYHKDPDNIISLNAPIFEHMWWARPSACCVIQWIQTQLQEFHRETKLALLVSLVREHGLETASPVGHLRVNSWVRQTYPPRAERTVQALTLQPTPYTYPGAVTEYRCLRAVSLNREADGAEVSVCGFFPCTSQRNKQSKRSEGGLWETLEVPPVLFLEGKIDIPAPLWLETSSRERNFLPSWMLLTGEKTAKCTESLKELRIQWKRQADKETKEILQNENMHEWG